MALRHGEAVPDETDESGGISSPRERESERRHRAGYERQPIQPGEFDDWEAEQVWGDE
jgi:hypothetical protein